MTQQQRERSKQAMAPFPIILQIVAQKASTGVPAPPPEAVIVEETNYVLILATLICALICALGLVAAFRCALLRCLRAASGTNASTGLPSPPHRGLRKKVLQSLPKINYSTATNDPVNLEQAAPSSLTECAICLVEFVEGDEMRVLPQCGHGFHVACIDKWLSSHSSCPSCRQILEVGCGCEKSAGGAAETKAREFTTSNSRFLP